MTLTHYPEQAI